MTEWHRVGSRDEVGARAPFEVRLERHRIAVFVHDGQVRAISNVCNHKGGPLCDGHRRGEFVACPWHGWEYSVVTGRGPEGYGGDQVPVHPVEERPDGVWIGTPPIVRRVVPKHPPHPLLAATPKPAGAPSRVLGLSTTAMDPASPRFSTSDALLDHALARAAERGAETRLLRLRDLAFAPCEGNYSKASHACTWPCAITERDPDDGLTPIYDGLVNWADVVLLATPIRWGAASSLYFRMAERLNCVQNQLTTRGRVLISNKVAAFMITGGQDNVQGVAGSLLTFWAELGFVFPPFPFIAHSRGWDAEDMENNVRQVRTSTRLRDASRELLDRALDFWTILDHHRSEVVSPMERAGRKASPLGTSRVDPDAMTSSGDGG
jgi:nitrite reductase/ring-hydroxylating ferredoxin subunit/multimeric flavodoxin WrbA